MKSPSRQVINRDIKTSMNLLLRSDNPQKSPSGNSNFRRLICESSEMICKELEIIGWRYKTSLPIIKPITYQMMQFQQQRGSAAYLGMRSSLNDTAASNSSGPIDSKILIEFAKSHPEVDKYSVQVVIENICHRLSDLGFLPFAQIIYLLKEMMIGYDVLMDIFGAIEPNDEMIAVNSNMQWRVWINQDYTLNFKALKSTVLGEKEFIYKLIFIAEKHCSPTGLSKVFFSEMKEFTYSKECTFIKILQKIKEFITVNKIFQCNKVIIASEKKINDSIDQDSKKYFQPSPNTSIKNIKTDKKVLPFPKTKFQSSGFFQFQSKSSSNLLDASRYNNSMISSQTTANLQKYMNCSAIQSSKTKTSAFMQMPQPTPAQVGYSNFLSMRLVRPTNEKQYKSKDAKDIRINESINLDNSNQKKLNYYPGMKPLSPQPTMNRISSTFINISKSRHELKALVNPKKSTSPEPVIIQEKKTTKKPARKYSQQIVKVKSLEALTSKKFAGSNIYLNDPQNKVAVNVIKKPQNKEAKVQKEEQYSTDQDKKFLSPNYSNPSTKEVKDSKEHRDSRTHGEDKYMSLKMNDLGMKLRNNQSSYYGMGNQKPVQKRDKNMAVSYSFNPKNDKNDENSSDASEQNENKMHNNNWTKKISGLFSDDASIKHLKGSVKFKTADEEHFEKEYLKDVKLEMLQKFGRPVRHSIVDEQDDLDFSPSKNPYKSMQLIEEVFQDGKSHIQKQEQQDEMPARLVRRRNQTVQIGTCSKQDMIKSDIENKKECISEYCQSDQVNSEQAFNFESESYVINIKK